MGTINCAPTIKILIIRLKVNLSLNTKLLGYLITLLFFHNAVAYSAIIDKIDKLLADSSLSEASVGIAIYDINTDSVIFDHESDRLLTPASNLKLFTTAAALQILGPSFRFKTSFYVNGVGDDKGILQGDLDVHGGGDPLISGRFRSSVTEILGFWADSLKSRGIKEIDGKLVAGNKLYMSPEIGPAWSWDDLSYWYACPVSALSFNDNCVDLKFFPGKRVGDSARIEINPSTKYITIHNNAITVAAESSFTLDY
ncbi:MAG TPA: D-alanyl-D-alanine carboxypeptidase/D-alanyl-D-alanine-endopeptidase, partial [candidate division Zixibacteria bacterium]|nr:D-alanyl-D-alanine carboxypeptidase/D-alanyl-D-alanine-endopeptidase [candidate division Zixibacteria bacterium]